jgi:threonine/homoserine/homoserine lactone efflux protein
MASGAFVVVDGAALGLAAGLTPGPLLALVISQSLRFGTREGLKVAFVPLLTDAPAVVLSLMLLSSVSGFGPALGIATLAGALFVLYLAYDSLRASAPTQDSHPVAAKSVLRGVIVNMLSPNPFLFWLMVGAPATVRAFHTHWAAAVAFVATFYVCLVGAKIGVALTTGRSRSLLAGRGYVVLMRVLAATLAVFGCRLFWEGLQLLQSSQPS